MDRAHRIGQKRVVSVYRLITRHTLEEKIMSLQRFKLHTARTVISADNASLHTMATDQVMLIPVLRIRDDYPGSRIRIFSSRIPDPNFFHL
jgi:hypothetical protein